MAFENPRQKQIIDQCKSDGEDKTRERLASDSISPDDRRIMEWWLHNMEAGRNSSLQKKNCRIQMGIFILTIIILLLTAVSVYFLFFPRANKEVSLQGHNNTSQKQDNNHQSSQTANIINKVTK